MMTRVVPFETCSVVRVGCREGFTQRVEVGYASVKIVAIGERRKERTS